MPRCAVVVFCVGTSVCLRRTEAAWWLHNAGEAYRSSLVLVTDVRSNLNVAVLRPRGGRTDRVDDRVVCVPFAPRQTWESMYNETATVEQVVTRVCDDLAAATVLLVGEFGCPSSGLVVRCAEEIRHRDPACSLCVLEPYCPLLPAGSLGPLHAALCARVLGEDENDSDDDGDDGAFADGTRHRADMRGRCGRQVLDHHLRLPCTPSTLDPHGPERRIMHALTVLGCPHAGRMAVALAQLACFANGMPGLAAVHALAPKAASARSNTSTNSSTSTSTTSTRRRHTGRRHGDRSSRDSGVEDVALELVQLHHQRHYRHLYCTGADGGHGLEGSATGTAIGGGDGGYRCGLTQRTGDGGDGTASLSSMVLVQQQQQRQQRQQRQQQQQQHAHGGVSSAVGKSQPPEALVGRGGGADSRRGGSQGDACAEHKNKSNKSSNKNKNRSNTLDSGHGSSATPRSRPTTASATVAPAAGKRTAAHSVGTGGAIMPPSASSCAATLQCRVVLSAPASTTAVVGPLFPTNPAQQQPSRRTQLPPFLASIFQQPTAATVTPAAPRTET
ncbi:hypothetical protein PTSG_00553 [Salpingoeca rosetta]|uniref:Uncharacterized protein n=1 Tax=Salpingoeca rosetta (strain ATCC 50818 / BSB-021) TaxID=946362 RepID=F2TWT4_SALR5|nr:uncharacterized protein PTSG_00553 [Salpingoeca rosetta]EGD72530.1 hypothetical protein PTSG_00553 [Salpingoeca rosetta]|eukprot:XP_004999099.1 hypothetical protein PTSG_00553 [Salpingoeca rosetta]